MLVSFVLHIAVILLVILLAPSPVSKIHVPPKNKTNPHHIFLSPVPAPSKGGGGSDSITPPSRGRLPRYAQRQFAPPMVIPATLIPKLAVEPAIVMAAAEVQPLTAIPIGLPTGVPGPPSGGSGHRGGIGGWEQGGIGDGIGPGMEGIVAEPLRAGMQSPVVI